MQKLRWLAILMTTAIIGITGFQLYWLQNNYDREAHSLDLQTGFLFRQTILKAQAAKLKLEQLSITDDRVMPATGEVDVRASSRRKRPPGLPPPDKKLPLISLMSLMQEKMREQAMDSGSRVIIVTNKVTHDSNASKPKKSGTVRSITISSTGDSAVNDLARFSPETIREIHMLRSDSLKLSISNRKDDDSTLKEERPAAGKGAIVTRKEMAGPGKEAMFRFLYNIDSLSLKDSITIHEIESGLAARFREEKLALAFAVQRLRSGESDSTAMNEVTLGFTNPVTYRLLLTNRTSYIIKKLTLPILFSLLLVGITILSFVSLYRSLLRQKKLAELKDQFISNVTHELKTPIATVGVAIEALKNFNAIDDPQRTREYLDISQNELQRLSLLVDKVLKLSMFEKKELELKKESFDCKQLVEEVMNSMKLQFEKYHAKVKLQTEGSNFIINADKLHITSVIYNLLDNALKYSQEDPVIQVKLASHPDFVEFSVGDNGIGIDTAYREKIFDKFFRVPTGDKHNVKGYGLGLSYVAEVVKRHEGELQVQSELGKGSTFTTRIPFSAG